MSAELKGALTSSGNLKGSLVIGGGTDNYPDLYNLPQINGVTLLGNKTTEDIGIDIPAKTSDLENDSGYTSSTVIAEAYNATSTYAVGAYVTHDNNLYKCNTAITTAEEWNAEHWTLVDVISAIPTKTSQLQNDSGFITGDNYYDKTEVNSALSNKYEKKLTQTLKVGQSILTEASVVLGANWSGSISSGFTHSSGSTDSLSFSVATTNNKPYLISFNATNVNNGSVINVKVGNTPNVDVYNGENDFYIGVVADGGNLEIIPKSSYSGTITNLELREITDEGDEVTFTVKNVNVSNESGLSGFWNVALGYDNFEKNENGSRNVALGYCSMQQFKSGTRNLALGTFALNRLESGDRNVAVGADSLWYAKKATDCIAIGHDSMNGVGTDIEHNIAIGQESLLGQTTGKKNIAIGYNSVAYPQSTGLQNVTCVGVESGNYANTGSSYFGSRAGYFLKGVNNTCVGVQAGAQQYTTGQFNTFVGVQCGIDNTGSSSASPKTVDNSIAIGYQARATKSNQAMIGSSNVTEVVFCGNKKIKFNNDGTVTWEQLT